ncbi:MAG: acetyl-CoA synthetase [Propionibacteriales bacterium]|nr:acetyl-CoA synthetase [Propionibacteriales bacterium]MQA06520.1 acetyl-CoA synthetase [Streptosporangiales bacterium]
MKLPEHVVDAHWQGRGHLTETVAKQVLNDYGIAVPRSVVAADSRQVVAAFESLGGPVAVKVISSDLVHKSDVGGVEVDIATPEAARRATTTIAAAVSDSGYKVDGFLVEEMVPRGHEVVVGSVLDPRFGRLIMIGLGGIFIEVLEDVAFGICPITEVDARVMLHELRGYPLLAGARGGVVASEPLLVDVLVKLGGEDGLFLSLPDEITEVDINPLIASDRTAVAADARFVLSDRNSHD